MENNMNAISYRKEVKKLREEVEKLKKEIEALKNIIEGENIVLEVKGNDIIASKS
jgi:AmiR/NasT family two-component response regulator